MSAQRSVSTLLLSVEITCVTESYLCDFDFLAASGTPFRWCNRYRQVLSHKTLMVSQQEAETVHSSQPDEAPQKGPDKTSTQGSPRTSPRLSTPMKRPSSRAIPKTPTKPKAASKSKASVAAAKAKSKGKGVTKQNMKRPASSLKSKGVESGKDGKETSSGSKMKRPAAAESTSWKSGIVPAKEDTGSEDEEPEEEGETFSPDPEVEVQDGGEARDRSKMQKFQGMLATNSLPAFLAAEWERTLTLKVGKRERQSALVNALFDRNAAGKLIMNTQKPIFQSLHEEYQDTKTKKAFKTLPKVLFCGKFNLSPEALEQGLREGQFVEVEGPSGAEYGWRTSTHADIKGSKSATGYKQSEEGTADMMQKYHEMSKAWKSGISRPAVSAGSSQRQPLAICDENSLTSEEWEVASKQLQQALAAMEQQEKNALKYMSQLEDGEEDPLYDVVRLDIRSICFFHFLLTTIVEQHLHIEVNIVSSLDFSSYGGNLPFARSVS